MYLFAVYCLAKGWEQGKTDYKFPASFFGKVSNNLARPILLHSTAPRQLHVWPLPRTTGVNKINQVGILDYELATGIELHHKNMGLRLLAAAAKPVH